MSGPVSNWHPTGGARQSDGSYRDLCVRRQAAVIQQMSNQILGPIGANTNLCQGNLSGTNVPAINLGNFPGQHFFLVGPEMRITSVSLSNSSAKVIYQTEANTNLLYRVERATGNYSTMRRLDGARSGLHSWHGRDSHAN